MDLEEIKGKLVVSCQALENEPLHSSYIMSRMAVAAKVGGAGGIRAQSKEDIDEIMKVCDLPVIGIVKRQYPDSDVFITPTKKEIEELLTTKCQIIALDATNRVRPHGEQCQELVDMIHEHGRLAMADCSNFEECQQAAQMGFDIVASTLSGYTSYSTEDEGPDYELIKRCAEELDVPVIAEGRIQTLEELKKVFECGAYSAVIGGAITRPQLITKRFVEALKE